MTAAPIASVFPHKITGCGEGILANALDLGELRG